MIIKIVCIFDSQFAAVLLLCYIRSFGASALSGIDLFSQYLLRMWFTPSPRCMYIQDKSALKQERIKDECEGFALRRNHPD